MKQLLIILCYLSFATRAAAQYAAASYVVLNEDMEEDYLNLERIFQAYHQEAINMERKTGWSIWKIAQNGDTSYEVGSYPDYVILEQFSSKEQMNEEFVRYNEDFESIKVLMKKNLKGKYTGKQIDKILGQAPKKEVRTYIHERVASTPLTGGDIKPGDVMVVHALQQISEDYEQFETEFWKNVFANNVMKGNHRFWGLSRIIDRNEAAYEMPTHNSWNMFIDEKKWDNLKMPDDFVSKKMFEITGATRKMYTPQELTCVFTAQ